QKLKALGYTILPTWTNFIAIEVGEDSREFAQRLRNRGVLVRPLSAWGAPTSIRVTLGTPEQNQFFIEALPSETQPVSEQPPEWRRRPAGRREPSRRRIYTSRSHGKSTETQVLRLRSAVPHFAQDDNLEKSQAASRVRGNLAAPNNPASLPSSARVMIVFRPAP